MIDIISLSNFLVFNLTLFLRYFESGYNYLKFKLLSLCSLVYFCHIYHIDPSSETDIPKCVWWRFFQTEHTLSKWGPQKRYETFRFPHSHSLDSNLYQWIQSQNKCCYQEHCSCSGTSMPLGRFPVPRLPPKIDEDVFATNSSENQPSCNIQSTQRLCTCSKSGCGKEYAPTDLDHPLADISNESDHSRCCHQPINKRKTISHPLCFLSTRFSHSGNSWSYLDTPWNRSTLWYANRALWKGNF